MALLLFKILNIIQEFEALVKEQLINFKDETI